MTVKLVSHGWSKTPGKEMPGVGADDVSNELMKDIRAAIEKAEETLMKAEIAKVVEAALRNKHFQARVTV